MAAVAPHEAATRPRKSQHSRSGNSSWRALCRAGQRAARWASPILEADAKLQGRYKAWWVERTLERLRFTALRHLVPFFVLIPVYIGLQAVAQHVQDSFTLVACYIIASIGRGVFALAIKFVPRPYWTYERLSLFGTLCGVVYSGAMMWGSISSSVAVFLPVPILSVLYNFSAPEISFATTTTTAWLLFLVPATTLLQPLVPMARIIFLELHLLNSVLLFGVLVLGLYAVRRQELTWLKHLRTLISLEEEEAQANDVLGRLLPAPITAHLKAHGYADRRFADAFAEAGLLCVRLAAVEDLATPRPPAALAALGNTLWARFYAMAREAGLYTVQAGGPIFLVAAGVAEAEPDTEHMPRLARLALRMSAALAGSTLCHGTPLRVSIALHAGRVCGGVVGLRAPQYRVWGEAVARAFQLNDACAPGDILLSEPARNLLQAADPAGAEFRLLPAGDAYLANGEEPVSLFTLEAQGSPPAMPDGAALWSGEEIMNEMMMKQQQASAAGKKSQPHTGRYREASVKAVFRDDYTAKLVAGEEEAAAVQGRGSQLMSTSDPDFPKPMMTAVSSDSAGNSDIPPPEATRSAAASAWLPRSTSSRLIAASAAGLETPRSLSCDDSALEGTSSVESLSSPQPPSCSTTPKPSPAPLTLSLPLDPVLRTLLLPAESSATGRAAGPDRISSFRLNETFRAFSDGGRGSMHPIWLTFDSPILERAYGKLKLATTLNLAWPVIICFYVIMALCSFWLFVAYSGEGALRHVMHPLPEGTDLAHDDPLTPLAGYETPSGEHSKGHQRLTDFSVKWFVTPLTLAIVAVAAPLIISNLIVLDFARRTWRKPRDSNSWMVSIRHMLQPSGSYRHRSSEGSDLTAGRSDPADLGASGSGTTMGRSSSESAEHRPDARASVRNAYVMRHGERLRQLARWVAPFTLPATFVALTILFSLWSFHLGVVFIMPTLLTLFVAVSVAQILSFYWCRSLLAISIVLAAHVILVAVDALKKSKAHKVPWADSVGMSFNAIVVEVGFAMSMLVAHNCLHRIQDARRVEEEDRKDFLVEMKARIRRRLTESIVEARMPAPVVSEVRHFLGNNQPVPTGWAMPHAAVLVASVAGFAKLSQPAHASPEDIGQMLHELHGAFDQLLQSEDLNGEVYRIDGSHDAGMYLAAAGCCANSSAMPEQDASNLARLALRMVEAVEAYAPSPSASGTPLRVRLKVSLHAGPAVASLCAHPFFSYGLMGPLVGEAEALNRRGIPGRVRASYAFAVQLCAGSIDADGNLIDPEYRLVDAGDIPLARASAPSCARVVPAHSDRPMRELGGMSDSGSFKVEDADLWQEKAPAVSTLQADSSYWLHGRFADARPAGPSVRDLMHARQRSGQGDVLASLF